MPGPYPDVHTALELLDWADGLNPGPWKGHSLTAGRAARVIAGKAELDADKAYVLGLLHDIGRYEGVRGLHHVYAGRKLVLEKGWTDVARVCLSHSFSYQDMDAYIGERDVTEEEMAELTQALEDMEYDDYDLLIQLMDSIALPDKVCPMQIRLVDVVLRYGDGKYLAEKWRALFGIKARFDALCGCNIYSLFRGEMMRVFEEYMG